MSGGDGLGRSLQGQAAFTVTRLPRECLPN